MAIWRASESLSSQLADAKTMIKLYLTLGQRTRDVSTCVIVMTRRALIDETMSPVDLENLLHDSYANRVVPNAMDHAITEAAAGFPGRSRPSPCQSLAKSIDALLKEIPYSRQAAGVLVGETRRN